MLISMFLSSIFTANDFMKHLWLLLLVLTFSLNLNAQPTRYVYYEDSDTYDTLRIPWGEYELKDSLTGNRYVLDSTHVLITAVSPDNDTLWQADPWKDNNLPHYRLDTNERAIVMWLDIGHLPPGDYHFKNSDTITVLGILYNNSQFGTLNCKDRKFIYLGQD